MSAILLALAALVAPCAAQDREEDAPPSEIRDREAYDHREPEDRTAEDAWRWPLRIALAPLRLVVGVARESARVVLEPIGPPPSSPDADEDAPPPLLAAPVIHLETEVSPAIGLRARAIPALGLQLDGSFAHWDGARVEGWLRARASPSSAVAIEAEGEAQSRADRITHGLGWDSAPEARARFRHVRAGGALALRLAEPRTGSIALSARATRHEVEESGWGERSIAQEDALSATVIEPRLELVLDSRAPDRGAARDRAASGAAVAIAAAAGADLESGARWGRAEARAGGTLVVVPEHDLTLTARAIAVEPATAQPVPFVELVALGGEPGALAGMPLGRVRGESAALAHLRYRWGIDPSADASLHLELGNAYGRALHDFAIERSRLSIALAIETAGGEAEDRIGILIGGATEPIALGATPSSGHVRFFVGGPPR